MATTKTKTKTETKKKSAARQTLEQLNELKALKKEIASTYAATATLVKSSKDKAREALAEAVLCGKALLRVKEIVGFGGFGRWLKENCKQISEKTAQKYMRLANHDSDLAVTSSGLRQAYISLGIIKEDVAETNGAAAEVVVERKAPPTTPAARAAVVARAATVKPAISEADALSRPRFLVNELLLVLNNNINSNTVALSALEDATLKPLQVWFADQKKPKRK